MDTLNLSPGLSSKFPLDDLAAVDKACGRVAIKSLIAWLALVTVTVTVVAPGQRQYLMDPERTAAGFAACVMTASVAHKIIAMVSPGFQVKSSDEPQLASLPPAGVMRAGIIVNVITAATNWLMFFIEVPIVFDQVTGGRVHLLRWCEWAVLAYLMTYMGEAIDSRSTRVPNSVAGAQAASTFCGLIFPFVSVRPVVWMGTMLFSLATYTTIFPRYFARRTALREADQKNDTALVRTSSGGAPSPPKTPTLQEAEDTERLKVAYWLSFSICIMWSFFVLNYAVAAVASFRSCTDTICRRENGEYPWWPFMADLVLDMTAKYVYNLIILNAHAKLFDPTARAERRLEEFRSLIDVVWDSSSDALVVSSREPFRDTAVERDNTTGYLVRTMVSPTTASLITSRSNNAEEGNVQRPHEGDGTVSLQSFSYIDNGADSSVRIEALEEECLLWECGFAELTRRVWAVCDGEAQADLPAVWDDGQGVEDEAPPRNDSSETVTILQVGYAID